MANATEQWTIKRLLEWTTDYFQKSCADTNKGSARLDAEVLLSEALQCQRIQLYTRFDEIPPSDVLTEFRTWVKRHGAGEPVAYIVGHREFYSLSFQVNASVLIPRPETEHVVVAALEAAKSVNDRPIRIIDVGTGSGCIAISMAKHLDECKIAAIDISPEAIAVAWANTEKHEVTDRIKFFTGDLLEALPTGSQPVHLIVSNPPYIGNHEPDVADDVRKFEPDIALFAGDRGTEIIERLVRQSESMLLPGGQLIFETSSTIFDACLSIVDASSLQLNDTIKDYSGLQRVIVAEQKKSQFEP